MKLGNRRNNFFACFFINIGSPHTADHGVIPGPGINHAACTCAPDDKSIVTGTAVKIESGLYIRPHKNKIIVPGTNQNILPAFFIILIFIFIVPGIDRVHTAEGFFLTQGIYGHRSRIVFITFNTEFLLGDIFIILPAGRTEITHMQDQYITNLCSDDRRRSPAPGLAGGDGHSDNGHLNISRDTGFGDFQGRVETGQGFINFKKAKVDTHGQIAPNPAVNHQPAAGTVCVMQLSAGFSVGKFELDAAIKLNNIQIKPEAHTAIDIKIPPGIDKTAHLNVHNAEKVELGINGQEKIIFLGDHFACKLKLEGHEVHIAMDKDFDGACSQVIEFRLIRDLSVFLVIGISVNRFPTTQGVHIQGNQAFNSNGTDAQAAA